MIELSVVVPTFNERENIPHVLAVLERDLAGIEWEVIFVDDDSPDGTAASILPLAQKNPAVRVLPLLSRDVAVETLKVSGLKASIVRHKDGKMNFADLAGDCHPQPSAI